ncbi:hypothetical protein CHS0354_041838 [Potamilus streckersoni]|uniref:Uncharacterized protein n=1 Tax=Potamilus streckersoni TaxID=2493646 RepID=A0AAE0T275_9BIVA|nr:hypothetical protein CHS0354_041838 [Potamilus streckersoni]
MKEILVVTFCLLLVVVLETRGFPYSDFQDDLFDNSDLIELSDNDLRRQIRGWESKKLSPRRFFHVYGKRNALDNDMSDPLLSNLNLDQSHDADQWYYGQ